MVGSARYRVSVDGRGVDAAVDLAGKGHRWPPRRSIRLAVQDDPGPVVPGTGDNPGDPPVVRTIDEAYKALELVDPDFEPLPLPESDA